MPRIDGTRPRVSRETRRLLAAAVLALMTLWVLARVRFPERPVSPNPVAPVLTQISPPSSFADLADDAAAARRRLLALVAQVTWPNTGDARVFPAWPIDSGQAITVLAPGLATAVHDDLVALDPPSRLAIIRITNTLSPTAPIWSPNQIETPKYFFSVNPAASQLAVMPVYVSSLEPRRSAVWPPETWQVTASSSLAAGGFIFTSSGEWVGIAAIDGGQTVIVPAKTVFDNAEQLHLRPAVTAQPVGIEVQDLTPALSRATGSSGGVAVTWVDPLGSAAGTLRVGDVIEGLNQDAVTSRYSWDTHVARLAGDTTNALHVRRGGELQELTLTLPVAQPAPRDGLGLTLIRTDAGSRISRVDRDSAGDRAGLRVGDLLTQVADIIAPAPVQVRRAFDQLPEAGALLVAFARDRDHHVTAMGR